MIALLGSSSRFAFACGSSWGSSRRRTCRSRTPDAVIWNVVEGQVFGRGVAERKGMLRPLLRGAVIRLQRSIDKTKRLFRETHIAHIMKDACRGDRPTS
jgi:hypothetical protein